ncbi:cytochrome d ubiquinol oxidase subunit II [Trinickia caryophylli]|uniref:Cytochrome bd-I ubiquinol oxidase subunit 2 apoprotein n=1 Tax=Trinickia caryophylli TaxID=28094 RepID=A0A1X7G821_TRICW|nr:cytochrome d ubiquinol oxidase subunit II [Trinickia caryophylli]PMS11433.1 cytochrome d ubiquinol oxidase subunit II [Trinickia caryophylli]TRX17632.1 cytochrome d ubiquinol oxidase subunit II [Trinickia caryophylli]WQE11613.1 cytochrome d ubiquinol oxidase subunit II [Trinickia caryophylli]SMF65608.1 cytochrome bd-I ubiquinol oxidase subunit 2 apoprotein [Trinickia caryophylli]GLU34790.1 cytochrome D ubiquinol oxidase subunit II [Trinickia caryophylli]
MELYLFFKVLWWGLLGVLLMGLGIMVGMDMGVGALLRYVGRTDTERRVALNIIAPHWDGNQVWFILGGGAIFAAFPLIYATAFSGLYIVMLLLLWTMIMRPLGFEYRSKLPSARWRNVWDWALVASGVVPMIVYGAGIGNMLQGVPFHFNWDLTSFYTGSFLALLNPFAVMCGVLSLSLAVYMGGVMLTGRSEAGPLQERARHAATAGIAVALVLFTIGGLWAGHLPGYQLAHAPAPGLAQTPLQQSVVLGEGAWFDNYRAMPALWFVPALGYVGMVLGLVFLRARRTTPAWWCGALAWIGVIGTVGVSMFPFLMPSSSNPSQSLTVWNSVSSRTTLIWMTGWTVVFVPAILAYTSWAFYVMRGKVKAERVEADPHAY